MAAMLANVLTALVALIHIYIVVLEMLLWDTPFARKSFGMTEEFSRSTKLLAANQGLYNGFLAAGLIWGVWLGDAGDPIKIFFLLCVAVAGVFGAATASRRIVFVQTVPALIALAAVIWT
jgi:putative membrane protein